MPSDRSGLCWDRARHARCPETIDRGHLAIARGPHRHHPTARMPKRRPASRLQGVPDPRAGIDAGGARGAGVTGAGPLRAVSLGAAGGGRPLRPRSHPRRRPLRGPRCRAVRARHEGPRPGRADRAKCRPRQCSRRPGNAGLRHRRWHDPGRPAAGTVPRSHRGRAGRAGRHAESERRRLKRAPRHPDRAAAGAGGRGASFVATTVAARR